MSLDPSYDPERLYLAVGSDMNPSRPIFTGDVIREVEIPGVGPTAAVVVSHPCSIRGHAGALEKQMLVAAVEVHQKQPSEKWSTGFFDRMPLPGLPLAGHFHVARLGRIGLAETADVARADRVACLSELGINQLQQRLVFHQTRLVVPTSTFHEAFSHTYEEAELLENWVTDLDSAMTDPVAAFETWIREGSPNRQERLRDHAERASIRRELGREVRRLREG